MKSDWLNIFPLLLLVVTVQALLKKQCCISVSKEEKETGSKIFSFSKSTMSICYQIMYFLITQSNVGSVCSAVEVACENVISFTT